MMPKERHDRPPTPRRRGPGGPPPHLCGKCRCAWRATHGASAGCVGPARSAPCEERDDVEADDQYQDAGKEADTADSEPRRPNGGWAGIGVTRGSGGDLNAQRVREHVVEPDAAERGTCSDQHGAHHSHRPIGPAHSRGGTVPRSRRRRQRLRHTCGRPSTRSPATRCRSPARSRRFLSPPLDPPSARAAPRARWLRWRPWSRQPWRVSLAAYEIINLKDGEL